MAARKANRRKLRTYWGNGLVAAGLAVLFADFFLASRPLWDMARSFKEGFLGLIPATGMCLLNATHALAFHQVDYLWLAAHILVLSSAVAGLIGGMVLIRPKSQRTLVFDLALASDFQGRETINNGSR